MGIARDRAPILELDDPELMRSELTVVSLRICHQLRLPVRLARPLTAQVPRLAALRIAAASAASRVCWRYVAVMVLPVKTVWSWAIMVAAISATLPLMARLAPASTRGQ